MNRDIITMGASMGGIEALRQVFSALPADLPASIFTVIHTGRRGEAARALEGFGPLPVVTAEDEAPIERGRIYAAPGDMHLLIEKDRMLLRRGPRENMARPAIDPLFRSAATSFGSRVIGVVLTGNLFDGASGMAAIQRCGGRTIVQDPDSAAYPSMPRNVAEHIQVDHSLPLEEIGAMLARLTAEKAEPTPPCPPEIKWEADIAATRRDGIALEEQLGELAPFTCPDCGGSLWEMDDSHMLRFRCHLGHAYTSRALLNAQSLLLEQALASALRVHKERSELLRRMAENARTRIHANSAAEFEARAEEHEREAEIIRKIISGGPDRAPDDLE